MWIKNNFVLQLFCDTFKISKTKRVFKNGIDIRKQLSFRKENPEGYNLQDWVRTIPKEKNICTTGVLPKFISVL